MNNNILDGNTKMLLLNLLRNSTDKYITLVIINPDMIHSEYLTIFYQDFHFKADVIERDYNDNLELYRNKKVKIDAVLGTMFLEEEIYIY